MSAIIIDGKQIAGQIKQCAMEIVSLLADEGLKTRLAVIMVGDDPASKVYVRQKTKACAEVGISAVTITLPSDCTQEFLEETIRSEVDIPDMAGVLVQLPLPKHLDAAKALKLIPSCKDVDGFSHVNIGHLWKGDKYNHAACTPVGIMYALQASAVDLEGKHAVIVGRSNTVGKPLAALLLEQNATVTICHSKTSNLADITRQADILIAAVGKPKLITKDMVKPDAVVVDVGINRVDGKLVGDVDFDEVKEIASMITPVPGGVGPLTVAQLMLNTANAAWEQRHLMRLEQAQKGTKDESNICNGRQTWRILRSLRETLRSRRNNQ
jgi:methylenetetrahydrofolate dehydrogenase (NADP+)/methenyltetrahydrofolate cyclohydrolase